MAPGVVIVGVPSSGKSEVGRALAERLSLPLVETDAMVEDRAGMSCGDIFLTQGPSVFRDAERVAVQEGMKDDGGIFVVGGGAIESEAIRAELKDPFVVWLRIAGAEAAKRAGLSGVRPVQLGNVRSQWIKLNAEREPLYAEVADLVVDSGSQDVATCVDQIAKALGE